MSLDLCRGDDVLGTLAPLPLLVGGARASSKRTRKLHAAIIPEAPFDRLQPTMQTRIEIAPGQPIFQHSIPPSHYPPRRRNVAPSTGPIEVPLTRLGEEEARGVPREQQLLIRAADGRRFVPELLMLHQVIIEPGAPLPPNEPIPDGALVDGSYWTVLATFEERSPFPFADGAHG